MANKNIEDEELLTLREAARRSGIKIDKMRAIVAARELKVIVLGPRALRIAPSELKRYWASKQQAGFTSLLKTNKATNNETHK
jgi:hypothetical protein